MIKKKKKKLFTIIFRIPCRLLLDLTKRANWTTKQWRWWTLQDAASRTRLDTGRTRARRDTRCKVRFCRDLDDNGCIYALLIYLFYLLISFFYYFCLLFYLFIYLYYLLIYLFIYWAFFYLICLFMDTSLNCAFPKGQIKLHDGPDRCSNMHHWLYNRV